METQDVSQEFTINYLNNLDILMVFSIFTLKFEFITRLKDCYRITNNVSPD